MYNLPFIAFDLLKLFVVSTFLKLPPALIHPPDSDVLYLLWSVVMVKDAEYKVTHQIGDEESPVFLRNGLRGKVDVIDGVDPHITGVVCQVCWDCRIKVGEQGIPILCGKRRCDGLLALNTDLIEVRSGFVVCICALFLSIRGFTVVKALEEFST